jgi:hypothetical protein
VAPVASALATSVEAVATTVPVAAESASAIAAEVAENVRVIDGRISPIDTTITLENISTTSVDLTGWRVLVGSTSIPLPVGIRVNPGERLTLHSARGTDTAQDVYLGQEALTIMTVLRPGSRVALVDAEGVTFAEYTIPG